MEMDESEMRGDFNNFNRAGEGESKSIGSSGGRLRSAGESMALFSISLYLSPLSTAKMVSVLFSKEPVSPQRASLALAVALCFVQLCVGFWQRTAKFGSKFETCLPPQPPTHHAMTCPLLTFRRFLAVGCFCSFPSYQNPNSQMAGVS